MVTRIEPGVAVDGQSVTVYKMQKQMRDFVVVATITLFFAGITAAKKRVSDAAGRFKFIHRKLSLR